MHRVWGARLTRRAFPEKRLERRDVFLLVREVARCAIQGGKTTWVGLVLTS